MMEQVRELFPNKLLKLVRCFAFLSLNEQGNSNITCILIQFDSYILFQPVTLYVALGEGEQTAVTRSKQWLEEQLLVEVTKKQNIS